MNPIGNIPRNDFPSVTETGAGNASSRATGPQGAWGNHIPPHWQETVANAGSAVAATPGFQGQRLAVTAVGSRSQDSQNFAGVATGALIRAVGVLMRRNWDC